MARRYFSGTRTSPVQVGIGRRTSNRKRLIRSDGTTLSPVEDSTDPNSSPTSDATDLGPELRVDPLLSEGEAGGVSEDSIGCDQRCTDV